jgi:hypothetical protein
LHGLVESRPSRPVSRERSRPPAAASPASEETMRTAISFFLAALLASQAPALAQDWQDPSAGAGGSSAAATPPVVIAPIGDRVVKVGDTLQFYVSASGGTPGTEPSVTAESGLPAGAGFIEVSSQWFSWAPSAAQVGAYPITFVATGGGGAADRQTIQVTVLPANSPAGDGAGADGTTTGLLAPPPPPITDTLTAWYTFYKPELFASSLGGVPVAASAERPIYAVYTAVLDGKFTLYFYSSDAGAAEAVRSSLLADYQQFHYRYPNLAWMETNPPPTAYDPTLDALLPPPPAPVPWPHSFAIRWRPHVAADPEEMTTISSYDEAVRTWNASAASAPSRLAPRGARAPRKPSSHSVGTSFFAWFHHHISAWGKSGAAKLDLRGARSSSMPSTMRSTSPTLLTPRRSRASKKASRTLAPPGTSSPPNSRFAQPS